MAVSNDFLEYVLDQFSAWGEVTVRKMFGGAGLYRDGKMFGLVADNVVYLKVDETNRDKFLEAGSAPFKPFPNRPTILSFFEIPPDIFENPEELIEWSEESLSIQKKGK
jgi:DNA transformation protein